MNIRIKFSKYGSLKFVGHLDLLRYLQKAIRRSGIEAIYTNGYNPHQIMSFASPLGVGLTSDGEYVDIELYKSDTKEIMINKLNAVMTEGFLVTGFYFLPDWELNQRKDTAMALVAGADYKVSFKKPDLMEKAEFQYKFIEFMNRNQIIVTKKTKKKEIEFDLKPFIYAYAYTIEDFAKAIDKSLKYAAQGEKHAEVYEGDLCVYLQLTAGSAMNIKPELVMDAFFKEINLTIPEFLLQMHRMEMYQYGGNQYKNGLAVLSEHVKK